MAKSTPNRSNYDDLHDKYHKIATTKAGTRYERLAALVFKNLEEKNVVIHDLKLSGEDPDVKHQIDVTIEVSGKSKRILVECKDFDLSGDKVGLGIIRDFRSVLEDTKADEGVIITCVGFTEDAQKYAKSKNIKLAIMRQFKEEDMRGRLRQINIGLHIKSTKDPQVALHIKAEHQERFAQDCAAIGMSGHFSASSPVYFVKGAERHQFNSFVERKVADASLTQPPGKAKTPVPADGWSIQVGKGKPIEFEGLIIEYEVQELNDTIEVVSERVAELILSGLNQADLLVFGDQIEKFLINEATGKTFRPK